jgi:hypothetical protein
LRATGLGAPWTEKVAFKLGTGRGTKERLCPWTGAVSAGLGTPGTAVVGKPRGVIASKVTAETPAGKSPKAKIRE